MKIKSLKYVEVSNAKYVENYLGNTAIYNMVVFMTTQKRLISFLTSFLFVERKFVAK